MVHGRLVSGCIIYDQSSTDSPCIYWNKSYSVFISHNIIWLLPDMIDSEIISNRCNHIWLCNRSLDGYTLKLQNDGRPCGVVRLYTSSSCSVPSCVWNVVLLKAFGYRLSSLLHANCAGPAVVLGRFHLFLYILIFKQFQTNRCRHASFGALTMVSFRFWYIKCLSFRQCVMFDILAYTCMMFFSLAPS